jgi:hypothetical protein
MSQYPHVHDSALHHFDKSDEERLIVCSYDFWVHHPNANKIIMRMQMAMNQRNKINAPSTLIIAPPGGGKSALIEQMKQDNLTSENKMIFVTMHQSPNGYTLRDLILSEMDLGVGRRARQGDNITPAMQYKIRTENIRAIVIDEIHDALTLPEMQQRINLSLLKNLSGSTYGLSVFAFGIPEAAKVLRRDPQLERRYAVASLSGWENGPEFRSFVATYIHRLPLRKPTNFKDQLLFLKIMKKGDGLMDNVVKVIQAAAMASILDGSEHIDHHHLDNIEAIMADFNYALQVCRPENSEDIDKGAA